MEQQTAEIEEMAGELASSEKQLENLSTALQEARGKVDVAAAAVGEAQARALHLCPRFKQHCGAGGHGTSCAVVTRFC